MKVSLYWRNNGWEVRKSKEGKIKYSNIQCWKYLNMKKAQIKNDSKSKSYLEYFDFV
jgi:TPP-dependent 2-oxoacid decarboxylase